MLIDGLPPSAEDLAYLATTNYGAWQRTEDRGRGTEDGGRRTEDGGRRTEGGGRRTEDRGPRTEARGNG